MYFWAPSSNRQHVLRAFILVRITTYSSFSKTQKTSTFDWEKLSYEASPNSAWGIHPRLKGKRLSKTPVTTPQDVLARHFSESSCDSTTTHKHIFIIYREPWHLYFVKVRWRELTGQERFLCFIKCSQVAACETPCLKTISHTSRSGGRLSCQYLN
jgi:hypothetical protein